MTWNRKMSQILIRKAHYILIFKTYFYNHGHLGHEIQFIKAKQIISVKFLRFIIASWVSLLAALADEILDIFRKLHTNFTTFKKNFTKMYYFLWVLYLFDTSDTWMMIIKKFRSISVHGWLTSQKVTCKCFHLCSRWVYDKTFLIGFPLFLPWSFPIM